MSPADLTEAIDVEHLLGADRDLPAGSPQTTGRVGLKTRLVLRDLVTLTVGWAAGLLLPGVLMGESTLLLLGNAKWAAVGAVVSLAAVRAQQLYLARVCVVKTIEIQRLMRACALGGLGVFFLTLAVNQDVSPERIIIASFIAFTAVAANRSAFRSQLRSARRVGRHVRNAVLIGSNDEAGDLLRITQEHPETGIRIVGLVANSSDERDIPLPYLGRPADALDAIAHADATGAIVVASSLPAAQLNPLVRRLLEAGVHVHVASGLRGIAHHRIRPTPLAHEPLLYLERSRLSRWQLVAKRCLDVALAAVAVVLAAPILLAAALAVWLEDRGPVLFRQERVGLNGQPFNVLKLRSMTVDAEHLLSDVHELNERQDGPLFKAHADPRVTRVGRFLRATSIDELPQLFNVLRGTMSLVGPRPALRQEAEAFDADLGTRTQVRPGITGLWQVEARDNPAFGPYRRLDLFYIENWSIGFDLSIVFATAATVAARAARLAFHRAVT